MSLEHIKETENTIDVFENDIELYTKIWCEKQDISVQDVITISQNRFNALLGFLYKNVFQNVNLKQDNIYNNGLFMNTNYNGYNMPLVNDICELYISLCDNFDKIISVQGFCRLTGISADSVYHWSEEKASSRSCNIAKKLTAERERTLSDRLASGTKNPVGVLGCLNHWHNWAGVGNMEERKPQQVRLSDVQKSVALLSDNSPADGRQIEQKQPVKLSDNSTQ